MNEHTFSKMSKQLNKDFGVSLKPEKISDVWVTHGHVCWFCGNDLLEPEDSVRGEVAHATLLRTDGGGDSQQLRHTRFTCQNCKNMQMADTEQWYFQCNIHARSHFSQKIKD